MIHILKKKQHISPPTLLIQNPTLTLIISLQLDSSVLYNKYYKWPICLKYRQDVISCIKTLYSPWNKTVSSTFITLHILVPTYLFFFFLALFFTILHINQWLIKPCIKHILHFSVFPFYLLPLPGKPLPIFTCKCFTHYP